MITAIRAALRSARFDPRMVLAGSVLMFLAAIAGFVLASYALDRADRVATPVANICRTNTAASVELASAGACAAADDARQVGPYVTRTGAAGADGSDGEPGADGRPGRDGAPGLDGKDGIGRDGADGQRGASGEPGVDGDAGADGQSPPCLDEPRQCRGPEGPQGVQGEPGTPGRDGAQGPPGPSCPGGTSLLPVTFANGQSGLGCVFDSSGQTPIDPAEPELGAENGSGTE